MDTVFDVQHFISTQIVDELFYKNDRISICAALMAEGLTISVEQKGPFGLERADLLDLWDLPSTPPRFKDDTGRGFQLDAVFRSKVTPSTEAITVQMRFVMSGDYWDTPTVFDGADWVYMRDISDRPLSEAARIIFDSMVHISRLS